MGGIEELGAALADSRRMAQDARQADLVLEGGGVKGVGLIGAISVLEEAGYTFRRIAGTSAGAIIGSFLAAGMRVPPTCREVISNLDYRRFRDRTALRRVPLLGEPLALWFQRGLYAGDYVRSFVEDHLADHGVRTFGDLREDDPGTARSSPTSGSGSSCTHPTCRAVASSASRGTTARTSASTRTSNRWPTPFGPRRPSRCSSGP